jgi:hypothetical protein
MPEIGEIVRAIAETARAWRDPDYSKREAAVEKTLEAANTFTREAIAFAVNQQVSLLGYDELNAWAPRRLPAEPLNVGVLNAGNLPFVGLQDFLAVILSGHRYIGSVSSRSPELLPAFAADISGRVHIAADFVDPDLLFDPVDAVIATGSDETAEWVSSRCDESGISPERRLVRSHRFSVAVLDGRESLDELENLAEDALLHEGFGCRNVAVVWAPAGHSPDDLLHAFARFRAVFPAHASTPGRIKMQQAFLEAVGAPHAHGEGLEFLLSKGDPDVQPPGHVRWSEYTNLDEVRMWLLHNKDAIQLVVTRQGMRERLGTDLHVGVLGESQRPALNWRPDERDIMTFLADLA